MSRVVGPLVLGSVLALGALGLALSPREALAQDTAPHTEDDIIRHGVLLRQQGNDDAALAEFRRAYDLNHSLRARAQMALAEQALGHWVDAEAHLNEALAGVADPWVASYAIVLHRALDDIARHLGSLDVRSNVEGAQVWINGEHVAALPMTTAIRLETGSADVEVRASGYVTVHRTVDITAGVRARETFRLVPSNRSGGNESASATPSVETPGSSAPSGRPIQASTASNDGARSPLPLVVAGVGIVALIAAGVFYGLRASAIGNCTDAGTVLMCPTQSDADRAAGGYTFTTAGNVLVGVGAVAVVAGAAWFLVSRMRSSTPDARAWLDISPAEGGATLRIGGRF